ncbi:MAG: carbamoyltransferase C-terminal domain-containing protein [Candidatus Woesearchaeota archaeon]
MNILAISDSRTDSGITYYKNGQLILALNEERLTRKKTLGGFPEKCINYFLERFSDDVSKIDLIIISGKLTPFPIMRLFDLYRRYDFRLSKSYSFIDRLSDFIEYKLNLNTFVDPEGKLSESILSFEKLFLSFKLPSKLKKIPIKFVDHHLCHISSAYYTSNYDEALVVSFDGMGDNSSGKIYSGRNGKLKKVHQYDAYDSFGLFYSLVTVFLGYKEHKHEGKITGLAAYGDPNNVDVDFPFEFTEHMDLKYNWHQGIRGLKDLEKHLSSYSKEDISAWLQDNTEKYICKIISHFLRETGHSNVCLSGGVFANVKLNQRIHELNEVEGVFIYPAMGDVGLSHGAILFEGKEMNRLNHVFYGPSYGGFEIKKELEKRNLSYKKYSNVEKEIANLLSKGNIVARYNGAMEYGPRALGNRSILVQATDQSINNSLNEKLDRTEFMPFAPTILKEYSEECIKNLEGAEFTSKFMNISFDVTDYMKETCPAAVHIDGTARPQILSKEDNPSFYKILNEYYKITGIPALINTSFNTHGEPIVNTPSEAVDAFENAKLDYLAIGDFIIKKNQI